MSYDEVIDNREGRLDAGDTGATLVGYVLLIALIAGAAVGSLQFVGSGSRESLAASAEAVSTGGHVAPVDPGEAGAGGGGSESGEPEDEEPGPPEDAGPITSDPEAEEPVRAVSAAGDAELYWWDQHGERGEWTAPVTFTNDWIRHAYLDLEVTRIFADGAQQTYTVDEHYVPAGGTSEFVGWSNGMEPSKPSATVVEVQVRVVGMRTSDENWDAVTYEVSGEPVTVTAPAPPN